MKKHNLIVNGGLGRMGHAVVGLAKNASWVNRVAVADYKKRAQLKNLQGIRVAGPAVLIDFSLPRGIAETLEYSLKNQCPLVLGTTGYSETDFKKIKKAAEKIPLLWSPNMSVGVNLMAKMIKILATAVAADYDWQLEEFHHKQKKDSPSGTAKWLQKITEDALKRNSEYYGQA